MKKGNNEKLFINSLTVIKCKQKYYNINCNCGSA